MATCPVQIYRPRRPQDTALYSVIQHNLETWLAARREADPEQDPIPPYVERAFREYLRCGQLCFGFARCRCSGCGYEFLVAFSCQRKGLCPSCSAKYMVRTAGHLVDKVLPRVPYRQWVLALPKRLRYFLHRDAAHAGAVLRIFLRAVQTTIRNACPHAPRKARFGAVSFIHRAGSTFNEHLHYHCIVTDGVFAPNPDDDVDFFEAAAMGEALLEDLTEKLRRRILRYMVRRDLIDEQVALDMAGWDHHGGFSLDASVRVDKGDRMALERLARYCARPPFAEGRLSLAEPQTVVYTLTKPDPQGRSAMCLTPLQLIERLAALIPPPRVHRHRYSGVLAPNSPLRSRVIASAAPAAVLADRLAEAAQSMDLDSDDTQDLQRHGKAAPQSQDPEPAFQSRAARLSWAMLLARIYEVFPLLCPRCQCPMRVISCITQPEVIARILTHLDEPVEPPPMTPARDVPLHLLCSNFGRGPPAPITDTPIQDSDW